MSALVASPAAAEEGGVAVVEDVIDVVDDEAKKAEEEKVKKAAEEAAALAAAEEAAALAAAEEAAALAAAEEENAKKAEEENAKKAAEEQSSKKVEEVLDAPIVALLEPPDPNVEVEKVEICHATDSHNNPYVINEPNASGDVQGHADHTGPIWFPGIEEDWGDIIPPFAYDGGFFPGLNWDASGQAIFENDCAIPPAELTVTTAACPVHGGTGSVSFSVIFLLDEDYRLTILDSEGAFVDAVTFDGAGGAGTFEGSLSLPPGNYEIVFEQLNGKVTELDRQLFTIGACPAAPPPPPAPAPAPVVPVKTLAATGSEGAEPLMAGGMIMLLLGGAALLAANRRRWGTSRSE